MSDATHTRLRRRFLAGALAIILLAATSQAVIAAGPPANDTPDGASPLSLGVPVEYNSADATESATDPSSCNGSHGAFPGPYYASVWFSFTAGSTGQLTLSAPTMQGTASDYLAISFVYQRTSSGLQLVDCTAYGNDASWPAKKGQTFLIMEAGLDASVTDEPDFSNRGGHGTIIVTRSANELHYSGRDWFTYSDCGPTVNVVSENSGLFRLRSGKQGDLTPYLFNNYSWSAVSTNPANGKWFKEQGQGLYRDLHITNVEGTVYTFVSQETGRPYSLTDMHGNKVFFDRGRLLTTFQVDTLGDADLSNDVFVDGSWQLLADNGAHPFFYFDGDWCALVNRLLG